MGKETTYVKRNYKDNVFCILYRDDKERQLELYNSVSGKNYTSAEELSVVTLKHAIYMGMKNDLAFLISDELHLYEHQSTINPNIPLRLLYYIAKEYEGITEGQKIYGRKSIELPVPYFVVFYNGTEKYPERKVLRLSDLYKELDKNLPEDKDDIKSEDTKDNRNNKSIRAISEILERESPFLELKVLVVNINPGQNQEFLEKCNTLKEYMVYVDRVRTYCRKMELEQAVNLAVNECIKEGILEDFLRKNKAEVVAMSIFEYDEDEVREYLREEAREEGRAEGREEGRAEAREELRGEVKEEVRGELIGEVREELREELIEEGIRAMILENLEEQVPKKRILLKLQKFFNLTEEMAEQYYEKYQD